MNLGNVDQQRSLCVHAVEGVDCSAEFVRVLGELALQLASPKGWLVPLESVSGVKDDGKLIVTAIVNEEFDSVKNWRAKKREISEWELMTAIRSLGECVFAAEKEKQGFVLSGNNVYLSKDQKVIRFSPLASKTSGNRTEGTAKIIAKLIDLCSAGKESTVISACAQICDLFTVETSDKFHTIFLKLNQLLILRVNQIIREKTDFEGEFRLCFESLADLKVKITVCCYKSCPGIDTDTLQKCDNHKFCSQTCFIAAQNEAQAQNNCCPLCYTHPNLASEVKYISNGLKCCCGALVEKETQQWRLSYLGSTVYIESKKYCSESCFLDSSPVIRYPTEPDDLDDFEISEDRGEVDCINCGQVSGSANVRFILDCCRHYFCSLQCYQSFRPLLFQIYPKCPKCSYFLRAFAAQKKRTNELEPCIRIIDQLKQVFIQLRTTAAFTEMKNAVDTVSAALIYNVSLESPRPLSLSVKKIQRDVFFLRCCVCEQPVDVHHRTLIEMLTWGDTPFLLMCEIQVHAVCSTHCAEMLTEDCPVCKVTILHTALMSREGATHPTKEVIKRVPCRVCMCGRFETFVFLQNCAHEVCKECLGSYLVGKRMREYKCPVCMELSSTDVLLSQIFT